MEEVRKTIGKKNKQMMEKVEKLWKPDAQVPPQTLVEYGKPNKNEDVFLDPDHFKIITHHVYCSG